MENVEITVKVNGKEVNLSTISTETFEAVKAITKTKKIPFVRMADFPYDGKYEPRLILYVSKLKYDGDEIVIIDWKTGKIVNSWNPEDDSYHTSNYYRNVQELK